MPILTRGAGDDVADPRPETSDATRRRVAPASALELVLVVALPGPDGSGLSQLNRTHERNYRDEHPKHSEEHPSLRCGQQHEREHEHDRGASSPDRARIVEPERPGAGHDQRRESDRDDYGVD